MTIVFWSGVILIAYAYVGYPLCVYLASRLWARPWIQDQIWPTVSVIMAVHNGAASLIDKIDQLLHLDYPQELVEVLVVSDGSTDGTAELLRELQHPRLRIFILPKNSGKAVALNQAICNATADILLFVDIRPQLETKALARLVRNFADARVGAVAGELCLRQNNHETSTKSVAGLYWRFEQWIRTCEAMVDSPVGVYGGFYAVRRALVTKLPPGTILDDMYQPLNVVRQGYRSVLDREARVWDTWPKTARAEFHRKVRTLAGNFQLLQFAPWLLGRSNRVRFQYVSHKLFRLLVPLLLPLLLASSMFLWHSPFYRIMLALQLGFYLLGTLGLFVKWPALRLLSGPAGAFCLLNAAVLVGFWRFVRQGDQLYKVWLMGNQSGQLAAPQSHDLTGKVCE